MVKEEREHPFQSRAVQYLRAALAPIHGWAGAIPGGDRRATRTPGYIRGTPDILCVARGIPALVELKSVKGVVSAEQQGVQAQLRRAGALVHVARSMEDLEGIVRTLTARRVAAWPP